jgi:Ser-tRNA(Ala) deacylase AlaX
VLAILTPAGFADSASEGPVGLVLDQTSFYAESGGQTNDTGSIAGPSGSIAIGDAQVCRALSQIPVGMRSDFNPQLWVAVKEPALASGMVAHVAVLCVVQHQHHARRSCPQR